MDLRTEIVPKDNYLYFTVEGAYSLVEAKSLLIEIIDTAIEHKINRILIDFLRLEGGPTLMEDFDYAIFVATQFRRAVIENGISGMRMAYLGTRPTSKFAEMVASNRGVVAKVTTDIDEARRWLLDTDS